MGPCLIISQALIGWPKIVSWSGNPVFVEEQYFHWCRLWGQRGRGERERKRITPKYSFIYGYLSTNLSLSCAKPACATVEPRANSGNNDFNCRQSEDGFWPAPPWSADWRKRRASWEREAFVLLHRPRLPFKPQGSIDPTKTLGNYT